MTHNLGVKNHVLSKFITSAVDTNMTQDALTQTCTDMTEAPKKFVLAYRFYTLETATHSKLKIKKIWGVSVISMQVWIKASQSYHCKLWFNRLTHISLSSTPCVSLISVSIGLVMRSHIRHPPIQKEKNLEE